MSAYDFPLLSMTVAVFWAGVVSSLYFAVIWAFIDNCRRRDCDGWANGRVGSGDHRDPARGSVDPSGQWPGRFARRSLTDGSDPVGADAMTAANGNRRFTRTVDWLPQK